MNLYSRPIQKRILSLIALIITLTFIHGVEAHSRQMWQGLQYFGEVRSVTQNRIVITDPALLERTFFLAGGVKIERGQEPALPPSVGDRVMVIEEKNSRGKNEATLIRIFERSVKLKEPPL
jgi:hypothetical protein